MGKEVLNISIKIWRATLYLRISREDNEQGISNSLIGQRETLRSYVCQHPDLRESTICIDDGISGVSFERPAFQEMMRDIRAGKSDCIIVNDLSRFGRNYLEVGEYLEKIFPMLGVRFIAVNDQYDSFVENSLYSDYMLPFKNLMNEAYSQDLSIKIRSQLQAKRQSGAFVGAFSVFGYLKNPKNRHQLIIDECAVHVVQDIFKWKIRGFSPSDIAFKLNVLGILTPANYKTEMGMLYTTPFKMKDNSKWSAGMIIRILKNPIYIGVLQQGIVSTQSFKNKKRVFKPMEEWSVTEDSHEAIISKIDFATVQKILATDTRRTTSRDTVFPFSGLVLCGECGSNMVRKTVPANGKKYVYYICGGYKAGKLCVPHRFRDITLENIVSSALKTHIQVGCSLAKQINEKNDLLLKTAETQKIQKQISGKEFKLQRFYRLLSSLSGSLLDEIITENEYNDLKSRYTNETKNIEKDIAALQSSIVQIAKRKNESHTWISEFCKHKNFEGIERDGVVTFIDNILLYADKQVEIAFRWQDECDWLLAMLAKTHSSNKQNEVLP